MTGLKARDFPRVRASPALLWTLSSAEAVGHGVLDLARHVGSVVTVVQCTGPEGRGALISVDARHICRCLQRVGLRHTAQALQSICAVHSPPSSSDHRPTFIVVSVLPPAAERISNTKRKKIKNYIPERRNGSELTSPD